MADFWKMRGARWRNGCAGLSDEQELAYFRLVNWMHIADENPYFSEDALAPILKWQGRKAMRVIGELVALKKLFISQDKRLHNELVDADISARKNGRNYLPKGKQNESETLNIHPFDSNFIYPEVNNGQLNLLNSLDADSPLRKRERKKESYVLLWEEFWQAYPARDGSNPKKPALQKFRTALSKGIDPQIIIEGAKKYHAHCTAKNIIGTAYVAMAQTWLNQERWSDDYSTGPGPSGGGTEAAADEARRKLAEHEANWRRDHK